MPTERKNRTVFASVGSRFSMDRLLNCLDEVIRNDTSLNALVQVGNSNFCSKHMKITKWLDAPEFEKSVKECDVFVSHAGMGNVLLAAKYDKPIIIMPRRAEFNEHINNHQTDTASALRAKPFVYVANNVTELEQAMIRTLDFSQLSENNASDQDRSAPLVAALKRYIDNV